MAMVNALCVGGFPIQTFIYIEDFPAMFDDTGGYSWRVDMNWMPGCVAYGIYVICERVCNGKWILIRKAPETNVFFVPLLCETR